MAAVPASLTGRKISRDHLHAFVYDVLTKEGLSSGPATDVADGLVEASHRGVDTHGIALLGHYVRDIRGGGIKKSPKYTFASPFPSLAVVDGDQGPGLSVGRFAIQEAVKVAETQGVCSVAVRNSTHPGAMAFFTLEAARLGYIAFAMTNTDKKMVVPGSSRAYFGTNPIAVAAPRTEGDPFSFDAATTSIPFNKVMVCRRAGKPTPPDVATDAEGIPTTDSEAAAQLLPLGGERFGYKGHGFASIVEVMCAIQAATPFGANVRPMFGDASEASDKRDLAHWFLVMRPDAVDVLQGRSDPKAPPKPHGPDGTAEAGPEPVADFRGRLQSMTEEVRRLPVAETAPGHSAPSTGYGKPGLAGDP